jgi:hypothetical protein
MLKKLAEASGWVIAEERLSEIAAIYEATAVDTRVVRELDVTAALPAITFEAD